MGDSMNKIKTIIGIIMGVILLGLPVDGKAAPVLIDEGQANCGVVATQYYYSGTTWYIMGIYGSEVEAQSAAQSKVDELLATSCCWYVTKGAPSQPSVFFDRDLWDNYAVDRTAGTTSVYLYIYPREGMTCPGGGDLYTYVAADTDGDGIPDVADFYPDDPIEAFFKVNYKMWYGDEWGYMRVETSKGDSFIIKNPEWEGTVSQDGSGYIVLPPAGWDGLETREIIDGSWFGQSNFENELGFQADPDGIIANPSEGIVSNTGISDGFTTGTTASGESTSSGTTADSSNTSSGVSAGSGSTSSGSTSGTTAAQDGQIADVGDNDTALLGKIVDNIVGSMANGIPVIWKLTNSLKKSHIIRKF